MAVGLKRTLPVEFRMKAMKGLPVLMVDGEYYLHDSGGCCLCSHLSATQHSLLGNLWRKKEEAVKSLV